MDDTKDTAVEVDENITVDVTPVSGFDGINMNHKREEGELFCDYRCRQWWVKRLTKFYLKGKVIWSGSQGQKVGSF